MMLAATIIVLTALAASASALPLWPLTPLDMAPVPMWAWPSASSLVEAALTETEALEARQVKLESDKAALDETLALLRQAAPDAPGTALVEDLVGQRLRCLSREGEALDRLLQGRRRLLDALHADRVGEKGEVVVE